MTPYERLKIWRKQDPRRYAETMKRWRNPDSQKYEEMIEDDARVVFETEKEKSEAVNRAIPGWADTSRVRMIYQECIDLAKRTLSRLYVIHEIPVRGKNVCGLHIAENLKIVNENERRRHGRKFNQNLQSDRYFRWLKEQGL